MATKNRFSVEERAAYKAQKQEEVQALMDKLHAGVSAISTSEEWAAMLRFASKLHSYSFNNQMLIYLQNPEATAVAGYKAWQKLGRHVKKGEKGLSILAPSVRKYEVERENEEGEVETEERKYMKFRVVKVFDISQTEGPEIPNARDICSMLSGSDDEAKVVFDVLKTYAEKTLGYTVTVKSTNSDRLNGWCDYSRKEIVVSSEREALQQAKTLAHEIAHAIMHTGEGEFEHVIQDYREVEAESVAFCVMGSFGLDTSDYSFGYVAGWSGADPKKVETSAKRIQKAVTQILDRLEDMAEIAALKTENAALREAA